MSKQSKIPNSWELCELGDLLIRISNGANVTQYDEQVGFPISRIETIWNEGIDLQRVKYIKEDSSEFIKKYALQWGDILLSHINSDIHLGKTGLFKNQAETLIHGINILLLRPSTNISPEFLNFQLKYLRTKGAFIDVAQRAVNQSSINQAKLKSFQIRIAPIQEQLRIVAKIEELFSELDKGIESLKTAQAQLKVYRQALLKNAFEGKLTAQWRADNPDKLETADALLKRIQKEREQRYQQQVAEWDAAGKPGSKPKAPKPLTPLTDEELAELPQPAKGWGWVRIDHIQTHEKHAVKAGPFGSALKKEFYVQDGYKIYGQEQVIRGDSEYGDYFIDEKKFGELSSCSVKPFDVLISLVGTIGKVLVLPETAKPGIINPRLVKISLNLPFYRATFFKSYFESAFLRSLYATASQGTTMDILNLGIIQNLPYPICSTAEQDEVKSILDDKFSMIDQLEETITTSLQQSEALRQSILKKAFSGQLVPQDPTDEPASVLLARIKAEQSAVPKAKKARK